MAADATDANTTLELDSAEDSDGQGHIATDEVYHLLQNSRRRDVVEYFLEEDGPVEIGTLAEWIAARECDTTASEVSRDARQRVYISLYQSHLDKLDEYDVVEYDDETNVVSRGPNAPVLEAPLEFERSEQPTESVAATAEETTGYGWLPYYIGVSIGGFASVIGTWLLGVPASVLSIRVLNAILLAMYALILAGNILRPRGFV